MHNTSKDHMFIHVTIQTDHSNISNLTSNSSFCKLDLPIEIINYLNVDGNILGTLNYMIQKYTYDNLNLKLTKIARILKYDKEFIDKHKLGIRNGYKYWIENNLGGLTQIYNNFYSTGSHPLDNALTAYSFLIMWQNLAVLFPSSRNFYFFLFNGAVTRTRIPIERYAVVLHSLNELNIEKLYDFQNYISKVMDDKFIKFLGESVINSEDNSIEEKIDDIINKGLEIFKALVINPVILSLNERTRKTRIDITNSFYLFLKQLNELAFFIHEGIQIPFKFLIGTEQIWPVVSEVITFITSRSFPQYGGVEIGLANNDFIQHICESNYSLFEIPGSIGHYNILTGQLNKIIRLKQPDDEERLIKGIVESEDYNCWIVEKIFETTQNQERAILAETNGDGIIKFYGINTEGFGEILCKWDVKKKCIVEPLDEIEKENLNEALALVLPAGEQPEYKKKLRKLIIKISAEIGKGAALIFGRNGEDISPYLREMEMLPLDWLLSLDLNDPDYILKAALVMDGANLISCNKIVPRLVMYPFNKESQTPEAWGLVDFLKHLTDIGNTDLDKVKIIKEFIGKGSKTHGSSNLTTLFLVKNDFKVEEKNLIVVSISADGPIKFWPHKILSHTRQK